MAGELRGTPVTWQHVVALVAFVGAVIGVVGWVDARIDREATQPIAAIQKSVAGIEKSVAVIETKAGATDARMADLMRMIEEDRRMRWKGDPAPAQTARLPRRGE